MGGARAPRIILFAIFSVPGMDLPEARDMVIKFRIVSALARSVTDRSIQDVSVGDPRIFQNVLVRNVIGRSQV